MKKTNQNILNILLDENETIKLRKADNSDKIGMSKREFKALIKVIVGLTRPEHLTEKDLHILHDKFIKIGTDCGSTFLFSYMKNVTSIVVRYFAGQPVTTTPTSGVMVRIDKQSCLPALFHLDLRAKIQKWSLLSNGRDISSLLTFLCLFRSLPTKVIPNLRSITDPFSGKVRSFDYATLKRAVKDLTSGNLGTHINGRIVRSEKAGPNSYISVGGAEIDVFGILCRISILKPFIILCGKSRSLLILGGFIILSIICSPYFIISYILGGTKIPLNGKLSVVYNQAGKARVVAMTNGGIQCLFSGLHDQIFCILRSISSDATFDQKGITTKFFRVMKGKTFHCFDLSSATDRLPIDIQRDILVIMGYPGEIGSSIISNIEGDYEGEPFKYSVGQPMGALSSGGMLALTHHVLVRVASTRLGLSKFEDYLILGDDIVIANDDVAREYQTLMLDLGVSINLSKSLVSSKLGEFAKLWLSSEVNISPLGSGLLLQGLRDRCSLSLLLKECIDRGFFGKYDLYIVRSKAPKCLKGRLGSYLGHKMIIDVRNLIGKSIEESKLSIIDVLAGYEPSFKSYSNNKEAFALFKRFDYFYKNQLSALIPGSPDMSIPLMVLDIIEDEAGRSIRSEGIRGKKGLYQFLFHSFRSTSLRVGMPVLFDLLYLPFKPGGGINVGDILLSLGDIFKKLPYIWYYSFTKDSPIIKNRIGRYASLRQILIISILCKLSKVDINLPNYIEERQKKKAHSRILNAIDRSKQSRYFFAVLRKGEHGRLI